MSKPEASAGAPSATRATHCTLEELGQKNNILTMRALSADADESWCERNLHKLSLEWKPEEGGAALRSDERDEGGTRHPPGEPLSVGWTTGPPKRLLMVLDLISKNKVQPATRQRPAFLVSLTGIYSYTQTRFDHVFLSVWGHTVTTSVTSVCQTAGWSSFVGLNYLVSWPIEHLLNLFEQSKNSDHISSYVLKKNPCISLVHLFSICCDTNSHS